MTYRIAISLIAAVLFAGVAFGAVAAETNGLERTSRAKVSHALTTELVSGYLTSSGTVCDTLPIVSNELEGEVDFGEYGWIDYYGWTVSTLHDRQSEQHRWYLNEFECAIHYGYPVRLNDEFSLKSKLGFYWNPQIGYYEYDYRYWGLRSVQSMENPYVVPFWSALWLMEPMRSRVRLGLRRAFALTDTLTLTPMMEFVWFDGRRFKAKYGDKPQDSFLGGAFTTCLPAVRLDWAFAPDWVAFFRLRFVTTINGQVRSAIDSNDEYCAVNEWPFASAGITWRF